MMAKATGVGKEGGSPLPPKGGLSHIIYLNASSRYFNGVQMIMVISYTRV